MSIHNIVWTAGRSKWIALAGILAITAACSKSTGPVAPTAPYVPPAVGYSLYGTVLTTGEEGAAPIRSARVEISSGEQAFEALTDAEGWYQFSNLSAGTWIVLVQKEGFADARAEVELSDSTSMDFMLEPRLE
jgi:hypothetical protein